MYMATKIVNDRKGFDEVMSSRFFPDWSKLKEIDLNTYSEWVSEEDRGRLTLEDSSFPSHMCRLSFLRECYCMIPGSDKRQEQWIALMQDL